MAAALKLDRSVCRFERMAGSKTGSVRERLLEAASELFYREGIHTVGIERVLERAGVAKASLYGTFKNKDELVRAYLTSKSTMIEDRIEARLKHATTPREKILAVFDEFAERIADGKPYYGCALIRGCAEEPKAPGAARDVAATHRRWRRKLFERLASEAALPDPDYLSKQLCLIYDGAMVAANMDDDPEAAVAARQVVEKLLSPRPARAK